MIIICSTDAAAPLQLPQSTLNVSSAKAVSLPYLRNRLSAQTFCAILCVDEWLRNSLITDKNMYASLRGLPNIDQEDDDDVVECWDAIET